MNKNSLVYSNARVKALENNILNDDKLTRLTMASSLDEAVKVLIESGYGSGLIIENPNDYEMILSVEEKKVAEFLKEAMPAHGGLNNFLFEIDVKNLKALMKLKYSNQQDEKKFFTSVGLVAIDQLKECVFTDSYNSFDEEIKQALLTIDSEFLNRKKSGRFIDITLDKAMYKKILKELSKDGDKLVKKYYKNIIDFTNFSTFLRSKKSEMDEKQLKEALIEGGNIKVDEFINNYDQNFDLLVEKFKYKEHGAIYTNAINEIKNTGKLVNFENERDDSLLQIFKNNRHDIFSISPIASYYTIKNMEIKMVRMILICAKNNNDKSVLKARMRKSITA